ncbi:fumarylacetoacetase [Kytococcus sedentarius]|uniref:fumarylacetoacetase n=1 Tax=Kytococcus sedentarius TaxID=1276 RepID=UPI0035BC79C5
MSTWPDVPADHPFGPANLPYGAFVTEDAPSARLGVRIGDQVLDLAAAVRTQGLDDGTVWAAALLEPTLNRLLELGHTAWAGARTWITGLFSDPAKADAVRPHLIDLDRVELVLPFRPADYVDFYASEHHATNVGSIFRPDQAALTPNWKHLPIGYHGRSSTLVVSGTDVVRPSGQRKPKDAEVPTFGPSQRLDIEAELGFLVGGPTPVGSRVSVDDAEQHLFGVMLFNDWSARDIQAWEYVPLGPFLGKSFASSVGAWVVPMDALSAARIDLPAQDPEPMEYLRGDGSGLFGLDIEMEVRLNGTLVARPPYAEMYWSPAQMLAHMTVNGAALSAADVFASGTISGDEKGERGSFLELSWSGQEPITLEDGSERSFLEDGDTVTITGWAPGPDGSRIGLGEVTGTITPAIGLD